MTTPTQEQFVCPECGKTFDKANALGGHRYRSHGVKGSGPKAQARDKTRALPVLTGRQAARHPAARSPFVTRTEDLLLDMTQPLREQVGAIEARLADLDGEARELREARTRLNRTLALLDPDAQPKPKPGHGGDRIANISNGARQVAARQLQAKVDAVRGIITSDARWHDGFTSNILAHELSPVVPKGLSAKSAREVLERLRDEGVVRHDRVVKGGGMQFKVVGASNGDQPDD